MTKPFLKWAGNKHRLIERIRATMPEGYRLIEPFAGSAAVFMNTEYKKNIVADTNPDLIHLYNILKEEGPRFIKYAARFFTPQANEEAQYYALRKEFNATKNTRKKAALFLYLNRHGYNGLCRYNRSGAYNVPFGRYDKPYFPREEMMAFYHKAASAKFVCNHFSHTMKMAKPGDVVYCDPPYVPLSTTANFTAYAKGGFTLEDQEHLSDLARDLSHRGIPVIISNHDSAYTHDTYATAEILQFEVTRTISCKGANRGKAPEILAVFG